MADLHMFDLTGKNAVVIGGAGGLGQAMAEGLAQAGATVLIASRKQESLDRAKAEIKEKTGLDILTFAADASKEEDVTALLDHAVKEMGQVDILLNSQGINKKFPGTEFPTDVLEQMLQANVVSLFLTCKHFGKYMKENGIHGKIINIGSTRGIRAVGNGGGGNVGYCTTKGAVEMLTKAFASDLGPDINVNLIGPTITYTPMMKGILPDDHAEGAKMYASSVPSKRLGEVDDLKGAAIFLASHASDFVTGLSVYVDGGMTAIG